MFSVAIIGSGIGAASSCYFLHKLFPDQQLEIHVFESAAQIGGRNHCIRVDGNNIEVGAGIAYSGNKYISEWAKEYHLKRKEISGNLFGLWNGDQFLFRESQGGGMLTALKMVDRYGYGDLTTFKNAVTDATRRFDQLYALQSAGVSFESPEELWSKVGLKDLTQISFSEEMTSRLSSSPSGKALVQEMLYAVNRVNYNQSNSINALAGMVSMCPMVSGEIFSLYSGWTSIHHAIYTNCKSVKEVHLSTPVTRVVSSPASTQPQRYRYALQGKDGAPLGEFDAVIMTGPLSPSLPIEWKLDGEALDLTPYLAEYQVTHATFIKGALRKDYFLRSSAQRQTGTQPSPPFSSQATAPTTPVVPVVGEGVLGSVLTTVFGKSYENPDLLPSHVFLVDGADATEKFSSIGKYFDYQKDPHHHSLFKIFSQEPLSFATLSALFSPESAVVMTKQWWAYPRFSPPETISVPFRMKPGHSVFNASLLERSVAAMEVSAVSGRNAALLVHKDLTRDATTTKERVISPSPVL